VKQGLIKVTGRGVCREVGLLLKLSDFFARFILTSFRLLMSPNYVLVFLSSFATNEPKNLTCSGKQAKILLFEIFWMDYLYFTRREMK